MPCQIPSLIVRVVLLLLWPSIALGSDICDRAAEVAAREVGIPVPVLQAITIAETGRETGDGLRPWPWAMNVGGKSHWFASRAELIEAAGNLLADGIRSIDIGCFQLNLRWHGEKFASLDEMADPAANALQAALFLRDLHEETGDWAAAAAAYHSRTPAHAERYRQRFETILAALDGVPRRVADVARANAYPLMAGGRGNGGSLVPLSQPMRPLFDGT